MENSDYCYSCGNLTEGRCLICSKSTCSSCQVPFTQHNKLTKTRCEECQDSIYDLERTIRDGEEKFHFEKECLKMVEDKIGKK